MDKETRKALEESIAIIEKGGADNQDAISRLRSLLPQEPNPWEEICGEHDVHGMRVKVGFKRGYWWIRFGGNRTQEFCFGERGVSDLADFFTRLAAADKARREYEEESPKCKPKSAVEALVGEHEDDDRKLVVSGDYETVILNIVDKHKRENVVFSSGASLSLLLNFCNRLRKAMIADGLMEESQ